MRVRIVSLFVAALAALASTGLVVSPAVAATSASTSPTVLRATLSGSQEPTTGDPNGSGEAVAIITNNSRRICVFLVVRDIAPAMGAHVHHAPAGQVGPHALDLSTPTGHDGVAFSVTCQNGPRSLIAAIAAHPSDYYVNVHTEGYPDGAIRGQFASATSPPMP